jgi:hypothetical protein
MQTSGAGDEIKLHMGVVVVLYRRRPVFRNITPSQKECRSVSVFVTQTQFSSDTLSGTEGVLHKVGAGKKTLDFFYFFKKCIARFSLRRREIKKQL